MSYVSYLLFYRQSWLIVSCIKMDRFRNSRNNSIINIMYVKLFVKSFYIYCFKKTCFRLNINKTRQKFSKMNFCLCFLYSCRIHQFLNLLLGWHYADGTFFCCDWAGGDVCEGWNLKFHTYWIVLSIFIDRYIFIGILWFLSFKPNFRSSWNSGILHRCFHIQGFRCRWQ